tara:strand:- start:23774 stop:24271 length:498 start_codon:yes stop_codon:yes gene_type:complete
MSGPGAFEPSPAGEYIPATITGLVDDASLPLKPTAGEDELWLIQAPSDVRAEDLRGLRFKLTGDGSGEEMSSFKAGGKKYRLVEEDSEAVAHMFVLPPSMSKKGAEFGAGRPLTRRLTMMRKAKGVGDEEDGGEATKTPGEKKSKKTKREKGDKESSKSSKKAKK